jgi:HD-like signal output (HDOD) protein
MYGWLKRLFSAPDASPAAPEPPPAERSPPPQAGAAAARLSWLQHEEINADFIHWAFDAGDDAELFTTPVEKEILAVLEKALQSKQGGAEMVRRMPGVIPQLLHSLRTESFSGRDLARKISNDIVLVAEVIRLANSSCYGRGTAIDSIEHAVLVLGHNGLRQLITSVAFRPIADPKSGRFISVTAPRVWEQSKLCAQANRMLAPEYGVDPFDAFLAGLIHSVGMIVSLRVMDSIGGDQTIGSAGFFNAFERQAAKLSSSIAREWRFPDAVARAVGEQQADQKPELLSPLGRLLAVGDYLSKLHMLTGEGRAEDTRWLDGLSPAALDCLRRLREAEPPAPPEPEPMAG